MHLHYDIHEGNGPPLMLLHGFMSSRAQWLANLDGLREFCTPVTVELWGHGRSPMPNDPNMLHPNGYIEEFEQIRTAIGAEKWYILGQSFGAGLTLRYALERPDVIWAQAFCNSNSALAKHSDTSMNPRGEQLRKALADGKPLVELPVHPVHAKHLPDAVKDALMSDADLLNAQDISRSVMTTRPDLSVREEFRNTKVPTLLLNGVFEKSFQQAVDFAVSELPELEVVPLQGGHAVNAQRPVEFNAALRKHFETWQPVQD